MWRLRKQEMARKITKKGYNDYKELIASEYEAIARMATSMAQRVNELEEANEENFDALMVHHTCMRTAFHSLHKGYLYQINPRYYGTKGQDVIRQALDNVGTTIEKVEAGNFRNR